MHSYKPPTVWARIALLQDTNRFGQSVDRCGSAELTRGRGALSWQHRFNNQWDTGESVKLNKYRIFYSKQLDANRWSWKPKQGVDEKARRFGIVVAKKQGSIAAFVVGSYRGTRHRKPLQSRFARYQRQQSSNKPGRPFSVAEYFGSCGWLQQTKHRRQGFGQKGTQDLDNR